MSDRKAVKVLVVVEADEHRLNFKEEGAAVSDVSDCLARAAGRAVTFVRAAFSAAEPFPTGLVVADAPLTECEQEHIRNVHTLTADRSLDALCTNAIADALLHRFGPLPLSLRYRLADEALAAARAYLAEQPDHETA